MQISFPEGREKLGGGVGPLRMPSPPETELPRLCRLNVIVLDSRIVRGVYTSEKILFLILESTTQ